MYQPLFRSIQLIKYVEHFEDTVCTFGTTSIDDLEPQINWWFSVSLSGFKTAVKLGTGTVKQYGTSNIEQGTATAE